MIAFIIAFRHPESTKNYAKVVKLLDNTLLTLTNQTDQNFMVYIGCNIQPNVSVSSPKIKYCCIDCPLPANRREVLLDRGVKRSAAIKFAMQDCAPDLIFMLDADDLVSKNCVDTLNKLSVTDKSGGYWLECGYLLDVANAKVQEKFGFNRFCGSSLVFNAALLAQQLFGNVLDTEKLQTYGDYMDACDQEVMAELIGDHAVARTYMLSINRPMQRLLSAMVCWKINTGENESRTQIPFGSKKISRQFLEEFSIIDVPERKASMAEQVVERLRYFRSMIATLLLSKNKN